MHGAVLHVLPILAAEKAKTAFYISAGLLVVWALVVSVLIGITRPDFPGNLTGQRAVIAVSLILVAATLSTAVLTSGVPASAVGAVPQGKATASTLSLAADPSGQLRVDKSQLKASAGKVTINFTNASSIPHNVAVEGPGGNVLGATAVGTGSAKLTLVLRSGTYKFVCQVHPNMTGTLIVS